ncbi:MAG TPA: hypothetical protein VM120_10795 [Bryobacteraceae bacterium]|nr:hypothetical protein [Bryobacteraceae bacterium]
MATTLPPRLGIAYRVSENFLIRAGAGLYYDTRTGQIAQQAFSNPPTYTRIQPDCNAPGTGCSLTSPDNWTYVNPQHDPSRIPFPVKATDQLIVRATERKVKLDNAWQYNFSVQRQLPGNVLVETAYVGTKGTNLMAQRNFNPLIPQSNGVLARLFPGFGDMLTVAQKAAASSFCHSIKRADTRIPRRVKKTGAATCLSATSE